MASLSLAESRFSGCILLVYGIPGSGKTLLTKQLCSESTEIPWSMLPLHFDHFYPPDTRAGSFTAPHSGATDTEAVAFQMKSIRLQVVECLDHLIELSQRNSPPPPPPPQLWGSFTSYLQNYPHLLTSNRVSGVCLRSPAVLVVDDNLPLRSMRHTFYQLARKYSLGFAQLCLICDMTVAQERNSRRQIPIPDSTIVSMERSLELPEGSRCHWESRSTVISNNNCKTDFIRDSLVKVKELVSGALTNPETSISTLDNEMKEKSRVESVESYVHQADIILRKCVSSAISEYRGGEKGEFAKRLNLIRRELLAEVRGGDLPEQCQSSALSADSSGYEGRIKHLFHSRLHQV